MANAPDHVLTHHVNVRNPRTGKVQTFEPGADVPAWARDALVGHPAYPERSRQSEALVKAWQASKLAAEAVAELNREG